MCYRTKLNARLQSIEETFEATFLNPEEYKPQKEINAFDFPYTPVIADQEPEEILFFKWGLIPNWAKDVGIEKMTLNSMVETCKEKPAFRDSVDNRCLVIANGYYEWQWLDSKGKNKQKFLIKPKDREVFAFAGIYAIWKKPDTGAQVNSYSILTTKANELISKIHNNKKRMPIVLRQKDLGLYLGGSNIENFAFPYEVELMGTKL
ncbi:SOS response-associated peptidase [Salinimicrobium catena]|uniref:SOS response-associated peptidase n=1 Tax=Salinimicrobium catena TaxID=390640 RepID=UPI002FE4A74A